MDTRIRPAEPSDLAVIAALIGEIEQYYGASRVQPLDERQAQVQQALFDTPPPGLRARGRNRRRRGRRPDYSYLWPAAGSTHSMFLKELFVRESARRHGIATTLVRTLQTIAADRAGCSRLEWLTDRDNPTARAFHQALGASELDSTIVYQLDGKALTTH
ncbi:MAG: GNAT family N-acetyltransferase [Micromonosporaceae bacterium]|nr:GNAT family N-acetyltransferase [Micromonosporaceae bacterium]